MVKEEGKKGEKDKNKKMRGYDFCFHYTFLSYSYVCLGRCVSSKPTHTPIYTHQLSRAVQTQRYPDVNKNLNVTDDLCLRFPSLPLTTTCLSYQPPFPFQILAFLLIFSTYSTTFPFSSYFSSFSSLFRMSAVFASSFLL